MGRTITSAALSAAVLLIIVPSARAAVASPAGVKVRPVSVATFSPTQGPMGTKVTIVGSGFSGATKVAFHGVAASYNVVSSTRITATVPCGTTEGRITVSTPNGRAVSTKSFRIT